LDHKAEWLMALMASKMWSKCVKIPQLGVVKSVLTERCGFASCLLVGSKSFSRSTGREKNNELYLKPSKKNASSPEWLRRQLSDPYVKWARVEQYRLHST